MRGTKTRSGSARRKEDFGAAPVLFFLCLPKPLDRRLVQRGIWPGNMRESGGRSNPPSSGTEAGSGEESVGVPAHNPRAAGAPSLLASARWISSPEEESRRASVFLTGNEQPLCRRIGKTFFRADEKRHRAAVPRRKDKTQKLIVNESLLFCSSLLE